MTTSILHIDSSARIKDSTTRSLTSQIITQIGAGQITRRDLATPVPQITENWINANFTPADQRNPEQLETLRLSDQLVDEVIAADVLVIGLPIYNFSVPASFKAWLDLIARVGRTFQYTETGPQGLLTGKRAIVAISSGGVAIGSDADFASKYLRFVLGFIGITDVTFVAAEGMAADPETGLANAAKSIEALAA